MSEKLERTCVDIVPVSELMVKLELDFFLTHLSHNTLVVTENLRYDIFQIMWKEFILGL